MSQKWCLRSWAEIDHRALRHNIREIRRRIASKTQIMGMVKANAYGHGAEEIARTLSKEGVRWFGVASLAEARELHGAGVRGSYLILGAALPEEYPGIVENGYFATISSLREAQALNRLAEKMKRQAKVHFKIDTGMGRLGVWWESAGKDLQKILRLKHLQVTGIYTHFASSDRDDRSTQEQLRRFLQFIPWFPERMVHASNSGGFLGKYRIELDCIRPGISMYGYPPHTPDQKSFLPVMTWKSRVTSLRLISAGRTLSYGATYRLRKPEKIAVLSVGYADGYPRILSNQGEVLIRGKRAPIRGRVTMDQLLVDVSLISGVKEGDEVILMGRSGKEFVGAGELARLAKTISYEILTGVSERVQRVHLYEK